MTSANKDSDNNNNSTMNNNNKILSYIYRGEFW